MKILFLAPLPPPFNGQTLASQVLHDCLARDYQLETVDFGQDSEHSGRVTVKRLIAVLRILVSVARSVGKTDVVYLTIAESLAGNLKDLVVYLLGRRQAPRTWLHLHGGTIGAELFEPRPWLRAINSCFLRRMAGVIVSGRSHLPIFEGMIEPERIYVIPNFAPEELFVQPSEIDAKFHSQAQSPLRLLYLSAMGAGKGLDVLLEAILAMSDQMRARLRVDFAGRFSNPSEQSRFLERIEGIDEVRYHGVVDDETKRRLFAAAHIFCLPTMYREGQPISILEAYASGCVVLTTTPPGILDIFEPDVNGYALEVGSADSIRHALERALESPAALKAIARENRRLAAAHYTVEAYGAAVRACLEDHSRGPGK